MTTKTTILHGMLLTLIAMSSAAVNAAQSVVGSKSAASTSASGNVQYVGTYEQIDTPMGGSISVLMVNGDKIKITPVDDTQYVNIPLRAEHQGRQLKVPIPEIRLLGSYRVSGNWKTDRHLGPEIFIVRKMEYLGGGEALVNDRERQYLPDFYDIDADAQGPLTLSELRIQFPDSLGPYFGAEAMECFYRQVERFAADLGDPETMPPIRRVLLFNSRDEWEQSSVAERRLQLARYVISMALGSC